MNSQEAKALFFAMYLGQEVFIEPMMGKEAYSFNGANLDDHGDDNYLLLKRVSQLSDDEAIQIARFAHQSPKTDFKVKRNSDLIHVEHTDKYGITKHISIYKDYGTVNANIHFSKTERDEFKTYKANIGEQTLSANLPIPYVAICDYLRARGYMIPFTYLGRHDIPVTLKQSELIDLGWAKYQEP